MQIGSMLSVIFYEPSIVRYGTRRNDFSSTAERHPVSVIAVPVGNFTIITWITIFCMDVTKACEALQDSARGCGCLSPQFVTGIGPLDILVRISNKGPHNCVNGLSAHVRFEVHIGLILTSTCSSSSRSTFPFALPSFLPNKFVWNRLGRRHTFWFLVLITSSHALWIKWIEYYSWWGVLFATSFSQSIRLLSRES